MSHNSYLCDNHSKEAALFCLCESSPIFICPSCLPKHEGHEVYPISQCELFQAIGKDKAELKRRNVLSQKFQSLFEKLLEREATIQSQAKTLMNSVSQSYGMWLEGNHRCFDSLLTTLREETALLLTKSKYRVSSITQKLLEKMDSLDFEGEKRFIRIPEIETLKNLNECSQEACSRTSMVWKEDYEDEVLQSLTVQHQPNKRKRSPSFNNEEIEQLTLKLDETKRQFDSLITDFQVKTQYCLSLEKEKESWSQRNQVQVIQINESKLSLEKNLQRISELEAQHNELSYKLESTGRQLQSLQKDFLAKTQLCLSLEKEKEAWKQRNQSYVSQINESKKNVERISELEAHYKELMDKLESTTRQLQALQVDLIAKTQYCASMDKEKQSLTTRLTESKSGMEKSLRRITELETAQKELTNQIEGLKLQLKVAQTDFQSEHKRCAALQQENKSLGKEHELIFSKASIDLAHANEKIAVLQARLQKWGITSDPPNEMNQLIPDFSTLQSKATFAKLGPYPSQNEELQLVKRGPVRENEGVYIGQWNIHNQRHGFGRYLYQSGDIYDGQWRNGNRTGKGRFIWADGTAYVGDFKDNQREGFGNYYYINGDEYSGTWVNDKMHGVGSMVFKNASEPSKDRYIGEYLAGEMAGIGARFLPDGGMYVGSLKAGAFHGKGVFGWPSGAMYIGNYVDNLQSGAGRYLFVNGDVHNGEWKNGRRNGQGRLTHPRASEEGVWVDDLLRNMSA